jgi:membrane-bound lytic murein transglycosylase D
MKAIILYLQTAASVLLLSACSHIGNKASSPEYLDSASENRLSIEEWQPENAQVNHHETIWTRIIAAYQLDINIENPQITAQLNWYKARQDYLDRVTERGERYLHYIAEQIEARNIPGEIALLPIVESAFEPFAYSHGRASGVWQFIPATGRDFGLREDWWQDGRRDIRASTEAALTYLDSLQREFNGDWLLALAAYNSGAGTVRKAMRANRAKGKNVDFWSLDLPRETRDYVPKLIALAKLVRNPEQYSIALTPIPDEPYFAAVATGGQIDLAQVAELAQTSVDEIYHLNPSYSRWAIHPDGPYEILIPYEQQAAFAENIAQLPLSERVKWQNYKVKQGDTLNSIARHFQTTPDVLKTVNKLHKTALRKGQDLLIPSSMLAANEYSQSANQRLERLITARQPANTVRNEHNVSNGETFWNIAKRYKVGVKELARWNGMAPKDPLKTGQKIVVWSTEKQTKTFAAPLEREKVVRKISYKVRSGDSLARISQKFNVNIADVQRWNPNQNQSKYLRPGQVLTLHVNVIR